MPISGMLLSGTMIAQRWRTGWLALLALASSWLTAAAAGEEAILSLDTGTGTLWGTVQTPEVPLRCPLVVIIAGSGPTDRDGNSAMLAGKNNSLKLLADALAQNGIASLRYDKRGIAASASALTNEADIRFEDYIQDAVGWIGRLKPDKRFSSITVLGHSEGSLIGICACQRAGVDGLVSLAGLGRPAAAALHDQLAAQLPADLLSQADFILAELSAGRLVASVPAVLSSVFHPSVQPYLISWLRYDPRLEIAKLTQPALIVQGTTDIQVSLGDAENLARAKPDATLRIIDGMNHVLKLVPADLSQQVDSYSNPALPIAPALVEAVVSFIFGQVAPVGSEKVVHVPAAAQANLPMPARLRLDAGTYFITPFAGLFSAFELDRANDTHYATWFDISTPSLGRRQMGDRSHEAINVEGAVSAAAGQFLKLSTAEEVSFYPPEVADCRVTGGLSVSINPVDSSSGHQLRLNTNFTRHEIFVDWNVALGQADCLLVSPDLHFWSRGGAWTSRAAGTNSFSLDPEAPKAAFVLLLSVP